MLNYLKIILRGIGQVMLQNNALTGLLFLAGIFYNSWLMGLGAIVGTIISTTTASILKYSKQDIRDGLYGFNGALVGIAVWFFFSASLTSIIALIAGAILSSLIMRIMKEKLPAFTAPFVISTWLVIIMLKIFNLTSPIIPPLETTATLNLFSSLSLGFGQVMFQGSIVTGIIFFLAIIVNSRLAAIYALYGALLGGLFAALLAFPMAMINCGLFGYNAVLCGVALSGKKWNAFFLATIAILLSVLINFGFSKVDAISLTAPFVLTTWIILLIKRFNFLRVRVSRQRTLMG